MPESDGKPMEGMTTPVARDLLDYFFSRDALKSYAQEKVDTTFKAKSKEDCIDFLLEKTLRRDTFGIVSSLFHSARQNTHVYELEDSEARLAEETLRARIRACRPAAMCDEFVVHVAKGDDGLSLEGLYKTGFDAQPYDEDNEQFYGEKKTHSVLVPFRVSFYTKRKHLKVKLLKFAPGRFHRLNGGELVRILENHFDPDFAATSIVKSIVGKLTNDTFVRSNLTSGVKSLVGERRLSAIVVRVEDPEGEGMNGRAKNQTANGGLIEVEWFDEHLAPCSRIDRTRWFWVDGVSGPVDPETLDYISIDCSSGICSKDRTSTEDHEWLIDEILEAND